MKETRERQFLMVLFIEFQIIGPWVLIVFLASLVFPFCVTSTTEGVHISCERSGQGLEVAPWVKCPVKLLW